TQFGNDEERQLIRKYLVPALRHFIQARDLCPLMPEPQRCLADNANKLQSADARVSYLERVALLVPYDPGIWYLCGREYLAEQPHHTWECWRRSLELSDVCLPQILARSVARLRPPEIIDYVFPDKADLLLESALRLYPQPTTERQPFLEKALVI